MLLISTCGTINKFIYILHQHREKIGTKTLRENIKEYYKQLNARMVRIDFSYPYFMEKEMRTTLLGGAFVFLR